MNAPERTIKDVRPLYWTRESLIKTQKCFCASPRNCLGFCGLTSINFICEMKSGEILRLADFPPLRHWKPWASRNTDIVRPAGVCLVSIGSDVPDVEAMWHPASLNQICLVPIPADDITRINNIESCWYVLLYGPSWRRSTKDSAISWDLKPLQLKTYIWLTFVKCWREMHVEFLETICILKCGLLVWKLSDV